MNATRVSWHFMAFIAISSRVSWWVPTSRRQSEADGSLLTRLKWLQMTGSAQQAMRISMTHLFQEHTFPPPSHQQLSHRCQYPNTSDYMKINEKQQIRLVQSRISTACWFIGQRWTWFLLRFSFLSPMDSDCYVSNVFLILTIIINNSSSKKNSSEYWCFLL